MQETTDQKNSEYAFHALYAGLYGIILKLKVKPMKQNQLNNWINLF